MNHAASDTIALPPGSDIRLFMLVPYSLVIVAPAPHKATTDMSTRPGLSGLFTFDPGMSWPDRSCCRYAENYLQTGSQVCFQFESLADALACHKRLLREMPR